MSLPQSKTRSRELLERARRVIPGASQTLSKGPSQWVQGVAPTFIACANGAYVWDVEGRQYLDLASALGPVILGYHHAAVDEAIVDQLGTGGITFPLPHPLEVEVAERLVDMIPGAEQVRFQKSGSDACAAAVRLARIHTGRDYVISAGYHGWHDWYMAQSAWPNGIPSPVAHFTRQVALADVVDLLALMEMDDLKVACVIIEPETTHDELQAIIDAAHAHGALIIFDEVITGFRLAPGGAQQHFNVQADLACFGKALGNGMPISAITGPEHIMRDMLFLSTTHAGETLSLAAAAATLDTIVAENVRERLWTLGERLFIRVMGDALPDSLRYQIQWSRLAPCHAVRIKEPIDDGKLRAKSLVQQELLKRGVLWNGNCFINYAMTEDDIDMAADAFNVAFRVLADALTGGARGVEACLEGEPIRPVFWQEASGR